MAQLFLITYAVFDSYDFATAWCHDCPTKGRSWADSCCKDDPDTWATPEKFLEVSPDEQTMHARLIGRRRPDQDYLNIKIEAAPWRYWQRWKRSETWYSITEPRPQNYFGPAILMGDEYIPREWSWELFDRGIIGV